MKKLKALSRAVIVPVVVAGATLAPLAIGGGAVHALTSNLYWYGTGSTYAGAASNTSPTLSAATETNWSTTSGSYTADVASGTWADNQILTFNTGVAAESITGQVSGTPSGVEVVGGGITLAGDTTGQGQAFQADATLTVDTPSTATNYLKAGYIAGGAMTLDGILPADLPTANTNSVTGPVTIQVSDTNVTASTNYTYDYAEINALLTSASQVNFGRETAMTLGASDFGSAAVNWTFEADTGGKIDLTGSTASGGAIYLETFNGNGGDFVVAPNSGTVNMQVLTLNADSLVDVRAATDKLTDGTFNDNGFSLSYADSANDAGSFPGQGGSGSGSTDTGDDGSGDTSATTPTTPKTPDTGLALTSAKVMPVLATTMVAAAALFLTARRIKPATKR
jgi:hypothetical protein